ncbi:MAG: hypothetical protein EZS28_021192 [Streblomastix strix]|uniref:Uncharacterized protein n=1 Tax=Streblomastix strix TaxID=222440 RepID=A0A5J4VL22_9EUKA|nr:MAG: hypothetical protein EZS28_021192 [Streblomastix strix]
MEIRRQIRSNVKKRKKFDKKAKEINNEQATAEAKKRVANAITCLKMQLEEREDPMSVYQQFSRMISDGINEAHEQVQSQTIKERIEGAVVDLYEYWKFADDKLKNKLLIGHAIDLYQCRDNDLCIIDLDMDHAGKLNEEEKEKIRQNIINNMLPQNVRQLQTARDGVHAYCNRNGYKLPSNKTEKVVTYEGSLAMDIFTQMYTHKDSFLVENNVVIPNSKVRIMNKRVNKKEILHFKELNDWFNATHLASLYDILGKWNLDLNAKNKDFSINNEDCTLDIMPKDIAEACLSGLRILTIHNNTNILQREMSLLPLFMGLNRLQQTKDMQYKEDSYTTDYLNNNLKIKTCEHWSERKGRNSNLANIWILTKTIKLHKKDYYESIFKPLIVKTYQAKKKQNIETVVKLIEKNDSFVINDKYVPKYEIENVVNIVIVTNNIYPLKIKSSDRHYVICKCNSVLRGDLKSISQFNPRDVPKMQMKKEMIRASISLVDDVIFSQFKSFRG